MSITWEEHPILKPPTPEEELELLERDPEAYEELHAAYHKQIQDSKDDPVYKGFSLPQQDKVEEILSRPDKDEAWALGGVRCYSYSTTYVFDPVFGGERKVSSIEGDFHVLAYDEVNDRVVVAKAEKPFVKGYEEMLEFEFEDGQKLVVTGEHLFLMPDGEYVAAKTLSAGSFVAGLFEKSQNSYLHNESDYAQIDSHITEDFQCDCLSECHSYDARSLQDEETCQDASPLQAYALQHIHDHRHSGGVAEIGLCNSHPSSNPFCDQESLSHFSSCEKTDLRETCPVPQPSCPESYHYQPSSESEESSLRREDYFSCVESGFDASVSPKSLLSANLCDCQVPAKCQTAQAPDGEVQLSSEYVPYFSCLQSKRIVGIKSIGKKLVGDHHVPIYNNYLAGGVFNHNSGKSFSAAKFVMRALLENPGTIIICWSQNEKASKERQQPYLWEMMPIQYRRKIKDGTAKINYSIADGFTGEHFVLPNESQCLFKYYSQFQADDSMIEGAILGAPEKDCGYVNIGTWCDEYLGDETLLSRLRSRCGDYNAKILVTFTPMRGYTPTVGTMLDDYDLEESLPASLLNGKQMPYIIHPNKNPQTSCVFYHSERNPFNNWKRLARNKANATEAEIMKELYGYPTKSMTAMFNSFDRATHVYDPEEENYDFTSGEWTNYQVIDPAGTKAWSCIWAAVNRKGDIRVWAEFPDRALHGEWAVEGKATIRSDDSVQWKKGPAADSLGGLSLRQLQIEWQRVEGEIPIFQRIIDIRFAHNPKQTRDQGNKTLQDELSEMEIFTYPSVGAPEDIGLPLVQESLSYDTSKPYCPHTNSPRLRFSKDVGNTIFSVINYCKNGKKDEALKDFIDLLRYLMTANNGAGPLYYSQREVEQEIQTWGY